MTPKAVMLMDTIRKSLEDLSTECWTKQRKIQLEKVEAELLILTTLLEES